MVQTQPPEKLDAQTVDNQHRMPFQFLRSLHPFGRGWGANNSPEPPPIADSVPHSRLTDRAARLSFCRYVCKNILQSTRHGGRWDNADRCRRD